MLLLRLNFLFHSFCQLLQHIHIIIFVTSFILFFFFVTLNILEVQICLKWNAFILVGIIGIVLSHVFIELNGLVN